jgi:hypothetical protein
MLLLTSTSDLVQVTSSIALALDVHASWVDYATGTVTPGRTNTAISTATTATVVASPAASTQRNVKSLHLRNKDATLSTDVTVIHNDGSISIELIKITLAAGDSLEYVEGVGFFKVPNPVNAPLPKVAVTDQTIGTNATAYFTNSDLRIVSGRPLKAGTAMRWTIGIAKSAAATAAMTFDLRVGTNGTTGDSTRGSLATGTQTAASDGGFLEVMAIVRSLGASGTIDVLMAFAHNLQTTGFALIPTLVTDVTSGTFDTSASGLIFGMSVTTGTAHAVTLKNLVGEFIPGTI